MKRILFLILILSVPVNLTCGQTGNFNDSVAVYFRQIRVNSDHYRYLWDLDLYGPVLFVDPGTRRIYANYPDSAGILRQDGNIFTGLLPDKINIANTAITWNGRSWAMIMLPLPENRQERLDLLLHELFHRSQPVLGFHMRNADNNHLDQRDGRAYLRLELEALRQALIAKTDSETHEHLANALFFRKTRYSLFHGAVSSENQLELNEGLAAYTGIMMSGRNAEEINAYFEQKLIEFQIYPTFVRSFAYVTTPLYGFILYRSDKYWNRQITDTTNLTDYFSKVFGLSIPVSLCPECLERYGFDKIINDENKRSEENELRIAAFKKLFIEDPHLEIRFEKMDISFDPRNIIPVEGYGTVYPTMRITDNWGILTVNGGALLGTNWDKVTLTEPAMISPEKISGDGWTLDLNKGYTIEKNLSDTNYTLNKK